MSEKKVFVMLISSSVSDRLQATNQRNAKTILLSHNLPYIEVDGMNPDHKESRNELFEISGIRGNYPQFFFVHSNGATSFFGCYERLEEVNEASGLPKDILEQHPEIETWDTVFADVVASF